MDRGKGITWLLPVYYGALLFPAIVHVLCIPAAWQEKDL
jgi:hypothetical protein